ncbi:MAG: TlpA family protein disulfide reductase [Gammaproteobacteria bacterium]|nr:TlpA family protein disulfide reductase [Gammaproteobacteria bacterium]
MPTTIKTLFDRCTHTVLLATVLSMPAAAEPIDFTSPGLDGEQIALSDYLGQWVVVNYWATWCAPCRKEIPDLSAMHDARDDITVLGLAYEDTEVSVFKTFLQDYPASYPIAIADVYDPPAALGAPRALPTTFIVDPHGELVKTIIGPVTRVQLEQAIADLQ